MERQSRNEHLTDEMLVLIEIFDSLEFVLTSMDRFHQVGIFEEVKQRVAEGCQRTLKEKYLAQIMGILPELYDIRWILRGSNVSNEKSDEYCLRIKKKTDVLEEKERKSIFHERLNDLLNTAAENIKAKASDAEIQVELAHFDLPEFKLPEKPKAAEDRIFKDIRMNLKRKEREECITPEVQAALDKKPVRKALRGLPASLLNKVRAKEFHKRQRLGGKQREDKVLLSILPTLCTKLQAYSKFTGKFAFTLSSLHSNLRQMPCTDEHYFLLAKAAPSWATIKDTKLGKMIHLTPKQKLADISNQVQQFIRTYSPE